MYLTQCCSALSHTDCNMLRMYDSGQGKAAVERTLLGCLHVHLLFSAFNFRHHKVLNDKGILAGFISL